jgi:clan AA aspartic protease (TIGR02281 family)
VRKKANAAREGYVQQVAEIRALVERLSQRYTALKADADAQRALAEWNAAANTKFEIKPSSYFLNSVKKLESLEKTVTSEKIPLRREGNSYFATVVINGKPPQEMIVDTGASSVVLPYSVAIECGVKPEESTATVIATVADGSKVKSKLIQLDSIRVGKFTAEHVECVVLPPGAKNAPTLLGMTYLSRFNFSINGTELVLSKIESEHSTIKPKKTRKSKSTRKPRKTDTGTDPAP